MERDFRKLVFSIKELTNTNQKMISFGNNFLRGIFFGVGSAIGASVIAAIAIGILNRFFHTFNINF
ncbi:MAG: hypothetical protein ACD_5C00250G0001 [uncultured bacterium]|nr:MAG: hypothetical protein ACD_5C00250G0001 [uncultured bacterium]